MAGLHGSVSDRLGEEKQPSSVPSPCVKPSEGHHLVDSDMRPARDIVLSLFTDGRKGASRSNAAISGRIGF